MRLRLHWSSENARIAILGALLLACGALGGASRLDTPVWIVLQPLALLAITANLLIPGSIDWRRIKAPLLFLLAFALLMLAQLIPLPPTVWANLPGHAPVAAAAHVAGVDQSWRPLTLAPDLTLASLVWLVIPASVLIAVASLPAKRSRQVLPFLLVGVFVSALLGLMQLNGGENSSYYLYSVTNRGSAVGLFANRNHQALLLVVAFPLLALWAQNDAGSRRSIFARWCLAAVGMVFLLPMVLVTGSRGGLLLALVSWTLSLLLFGLSVSRFQDRIVRKWGLIGIALLVVGGVLVSAAAVGLTRDEALQRLITGSVTSDARASYMPTLFRIAQDFAPFGTGFGTFDPVFRMYEPFETLEANYFNHAHNEPLEVLITGGWVAVAICLAFLAWFGVRVVKVLGSGGTSERRAFAIAAICVMTLMVLSSAVDYPLRTPLLAAIFALCSEWLVNGGLRRTARADEAEPNPPGEMARMRLYDTSNRS